MGSDGGRGNFQLSFSYDRLKASLKEAYARQIPFAHSKALNDTAEDAQNELIDSLPGTFTIRDGFTAKGIRVGRSTKRDLTATVGTIDDYMARQIEGGTKSAESGRLVGIPIAARKSRKSKTPRSLWPGAIAKRKTAFTAVIGPGRIGLYARVGRGDDAPIRLMYVLQPTVVVKGRWPFDSIVHKTIAKHYGPNMKRALKHALRTAKR